MLVFRTITLCGGVLAAFGDICERGWYLPSLAFFRPLDCCVGVRFARARSLGLFLIRPGEASIFPFGAVSPFTQGCSRAISAVYLVDGFTSNKWESKSLAEADKFFAQRGNLSTNFARTKSSLGTV
jgi:hypothetical protein